MAITGDAPGKGAYKCSACGSVITLADGETLPPCPICSKLRFSVIGKMPEGAPSSTHRAVRINDRDTLKPPKKDKL